MPVRSGAVREVRGAAGTMRMGRKGGRVAAGKHFFACTTAALPPPPYRKEMPDQVGHDDLQRLRALQVRL